MVAEPLRSYSKSGVTVLHHKLLLVQMATLFQTLLHFIGRCVFLHEELLTGSSEPIRRIVIVSPVSVFVTEAVSAAEQRESNTGTGLSSEL